MHALTKLAGVVLAMALLVAATEIAARKNDRELMVPPPDAVAEGFVREIVMKRWTRAEEYLDKEVAHERLKQLGKSIEAQVGDPIQFEAKTISRTDHDALVNVRLSSGKGSEAIAFALVFDDEWKIVLD